jgi:hypothetical protein
MRIIAGFSLTLGLENKYMEKLIIDLPEEKSTLVKQLLKELGVKFDSISLEDNKDKAFLSNVSVWSEKEIQSIIEVSKSLGSAPIQEW